jgi:hypothetical protein
MAIESSSLSVCSSLSSSLFPVYAFLILSVSFSVLPSISPSFFCFLFISVRVYFSCHSSCLSCLHVALHIYILLYLCPLFYLSPVCFLFSFFFLQSLVAYFYLFSISSYLLLSISPHTHYLGYGWTPEKLAFIFRQGQRLPLLHRAQTSREATQSASHSGP